jgi:hypothetical protein
MTTEEDFEALLGRAARLDTELKQLRKVADELAALMPNPDNQGFQFGKWLWISFDKMVGWNGDDETAREKFLTNVIPKQLLQWRKEVHQALTAYNNLPQRLNLAKS